MKKNLKKYTKIKKILYDDYMKYSSSPTNVENYIGKFSYEDEVICFISSHMGETEFDISRNLIHMLISIETALKNTGAKIHIFFTSKQLKEINYLTNYFTNNISIEKRSKIKISIIDYKSLMDMTKFRIIKRAKKFGEPITFANMNFWIMINDFYKNTIISHNDILFIDVNKYSDKSFYESLILDCDVSTKLGKIWISESENKEYFDLANANISKWLDFDKGSFINNHIHTGILAMNEEFKFKFKDFFLSNIEKWIDEQDKYKFIEQEIIALYIYSSKYNWKVWNMRDNQEYAAALHYKEMDSSLFIHYDVSEKGLIYMKKWNSFNKYPKCFKILHLETEIILKKIIKSNANKKKNNWNLLKKLWKM